MSADTRPEDVVIGVENVHKRYLASRSAFRMAGYALLSGAAALWPGGSGKRLLGGRLQGLRRTLSQNFQALDGISFEVARGECVGIIGLNGAGKSTLLQIVAGTLTPSAGRVLTRGRIAALLELGSGFHGEFTGRENVYLNATILGLTPQEIDRRMEAIAAFAEIGDFIDKPLKTYSSGMVVRLAFSVLTQVAPDILIVDEALSVGDIYFQHKSMRHMRELRDRGVSMLFVSHTGEIIKTLCDRAILLHKGRLVLDGDPSTVVDHYHGMLAEKKADESVRALSASRERSLVRSGTRQAEFVEVELLNAGGRPQRAFRVGEPAVLRCLVRVREKLSNPTFGFIIRDRFGNSVFGTNTFIHELPPVYPEAGEHLEVRFELPLNLGYGHYSVSVSAHAGATHYEGNYDWIDQILVFQILPDEKHKFVGTAALPVTLARRTVAPPPARERP
jgi:lipopolysaccharide transport system ATP-binding protein